MNHKLWNATGARVIALTFVIAGLAACGDNLSDTRAGAPSDNPTSPSAVVIGQAPADPSKPTADTAQVTPPAGAQGELSKSQESTTRPREGDNHSYSTLDPITKQKAEGASATEMERKVQ
ncbi:MAG TPA: hypothetical protein VEC19_02210 [Usitatibacter sp.]|nr:hypothetical protein [Usitatibacter sp.]